MKVIRPESLRRRMRKDAEKILKLYCTRIPIRKFEKVFCLSLSCAIRVADLVITAVFSRIFSPRYQLQSLQCVVAGSSLTSDITWGRSSNILYVTIRGKRKEKGYVSECSMVGADSSFYCCRNSTGGAACQRSAGLVQTDKTGRD